MLRTLSVTLLFVSLASSLAGCPGGGGSSPVDPPDAAPAADAPRPPPPPDAPLRGYGQPCSDGNQCESGLCIGETAGAFVCSVPCSLEVANACRDVDAFCVPIGDGDAGCFGSIETGNDLDDAIVSVGDSVSRAVTPLDDADLFQVRLDQLGTIRFTVTPNPSIDVKLEAYGMIGAPLGVSADGAAGEAELLETQVQQLGSHLFLVVRNVGSSTGGYTFAVTKVTGMAATTGGDAPALARPRALLRAP